MSNIKEHDTVIVNSELADNDLIAYDFVGTVVHIYSNNKVVSVEDQDNNVWDVDIESVRLKEDKE